MRIGFLKFTLLLVLFVSCNDEGTAPIDRKSIYKGEYYKLIEAISINNPKEIEELVNKYSLDVNHRDLEYGITLLEWALRHDKKKAFKKLLDMGADPNFRDSTSNIPVISMAAELLDIDYLQSCLNHKGNPNINSINSKQGDNSLSPLEAAVSGTIPFGKNRIKNIDLLVKYGADVNYAPDSSGPLTLALISNNLPETYTLLKHGADPLSVKYKTANRGTLGICQVLRESEEDIPSDDYNIKMEIVKYLKDNYGIDYFSTPIPEVVRKDHGKVYLDKY